MYTIEKYVCVPIEKQLTNKNMFKWLIKSRKYLYIFKYTINYKKDIIICKMFYSGK